MDPVTAKLMSAGGAAADRIYVDDVFSTFLYEGSTTYGANKNINNGINLSEEGGLVWVKGRSASNTYHGLFDTERGALRALYSNTSSAEVVATGTQDLYQFNNNGFNIGANWNVDLNSPNNDYVSWTFRKAPGFFDVVTYTGNNTAGRQVAHNLGSVPGSIWIKRLDGTDSWVVYHRSLGNNKYIFLNTTGQALTDNNINWNGTSPTSTHFTVGTGSGYANGNNLTYVAYIFAHDDQSFGDDGNEAIIKCGSYTGSGSAGNSVNVGFEPQWLLIKKSSASGDWLMFDSMRGIFVGQDDPTLLANSTLPESQATSNVVKRTATGFILEDSSTGNASSSTYIYIAICRSHKTPEDAADVFQPNLKSSNQTITTDFPVDLCVAQYTGGGSPVWVDRMRGIFTDKTDHVQKYLNSSSTVAQGTDGGTLGLKDFDSTGYEHSLGNFEQATLAFKRAKGFFDIVAYTGTTSTSNNVAHNLGVVPSMMILKKTNSTGQWAVRTVGSGDLDRTGFQLNGSYASTNTGFGTTGLTTTTFNPYYISTDDGSGNGTYPDNALNSSGDSYVAYLFASLTGISKVGNYAGTGSNIDVDCGFTAGARFVMIKRTDSNGDWFHWNTALGINSGNDPYLRMNSSGSKVTNTDYIDPLNAGFTVTSSAPAALNASGGNYIFLAIA